MSRRSPQKPRVRLDSSLFTAEQLEALARHMALLAIGKIQRRCEKGQALEGRFKPYSYAYRKLREAAGRRGDPPNLTVSGAMLNSLAVAEAGPGWSIVGFVGSAPATRFKKSRARTGRSGKRLTKSVSKSSSRVVANALKAQANHERRPFFGLTAEEQAELHREVGNLASKLLREKPRR